MEEKGQVEVRAEEETFQPKSEKVFRVKPPSVTVGRGETFDILLNCRKGFSVYIPYPEFFETLDCEAKPVKPGEISDPPKKQWWRVQIKRKAGENFTDIEEMAYCIYSKDLDNFAVGNSPPKMTVKP